MRIIIAIAAFAVTLGGVFIFGNLSKKPGEQLALIDSLSAIETPDISSSPIPSYSQLPTSPKISPTRPAEPSPVQNHIFIISNLPLTFKLRQTAELKTQTFPQSQCSIKVILPSGNTSTAKGLETKTSDQSGFISWSWAVSWNTQPGTGKIELDCTQNKMKSSKVLVFTITN